MIMLHKGFVCSWHYFGAIIICEVLEPGDITPLPMGCQVSKNGTKKTWNNGPLRPNYAQMWENDGHARENNVHILNNNDSIFTWQWHP